MENRVNWKLEHMIHAWVLNQEKERDLAAMQAAMGLDSETREIKIQRYLREIEEGGNGR